MILKLEPNLLKIGFHSKGCPLPTQPKVYSQVYPWAHLSARQRHRRHQSPKFVYPCTKEQTTDVPNYTKIESSLSPALPSVSATVGPNCKSPPKMRFKKFVKLTDHTCACNHLTNSESVCVLCYDRKRKLFEFAGICLEKFVKSHQVNLYFRRVLDIWNHCALFLLQIGRTKARSTLPIFF